jgi:hypothetical protein
MTFRDTARPRQIHHAETDNPDGSLHGTTVEHQLAIHLPSGIGSRAQLWNKKGVTHEMLPLS